jgi:chemotaxis protein histidine kinase CheA
MLSDEEIERFIVEFPRRADNIAQLICAIRRGNAELTIARPDLARQQLVQQEALAAIASNLRKVLSVDTKATSGIAAARCEARCAEMRIVRLNRQLADVEDANLGQLPCRLLPADIEDRTRDALAASLLKMSRQMEDLQDEVMQAKAQHARKVKGLKEKKRLIRAQSESLKRQLNSLDLELLSDMRRQVERISEAGSPGHVPG